MIITPHLGIGDLLILKIKQISNNLNITHININKNLILEYSSNPILKLETTIQLIKLIFPNITISITTTINCNFYIIDEYNIYQCYLYNHINTELLNIDINYTDYIVFHTKLRLDGYMDNFNDCFLQELNSFFSNFKTSKKIILLGEKNIEKNLETNIHKIISLYDNLLLLNNNNIVIDLTKEFLTSGNDNCTDFLKDIKIINKAVCNITFGIGGPFTICNCFSKKVISFIPFLNHITSYKKNINQINEINNCIVGNIKELTNKIQSYIF